VAACWVDIDGVALVPGEQDHDWVLSRLTPDSEICVALTEKSIPPGCGEPLLFRDHSPLADKAGLPPPPL